MSWALALLSVFSPILAPARIRLGSLGPQKTFPKKMFWQTAGSLLQSTFAFYLPPGSI